MDLTKIRTGCTSSLNAALEYAKHGLRVVPTYRVSRLGQCGCGNAQCPDAGAHGHRKHLDVGGYLEPEDIKRAWKPKSRSGVGLITGSQNHLIAIGVKSPGGMKSLSDLMRKHGALPWTVQCATYDRRYILLEYGSCIATTAQYIPGIDILGDGACVPVPPSRPDGSVLRWVTYHTPGAVYVASATGAWETIFKLLPLGPGGLSK